MKFKAQVFTITATTYVKDNIGHLLFLVKFFNTTTVDTSLQWYKTATDNRCKF